MTNHTGVFVIIHPFHPGKGKTFEMLDRKMVWGDDRILYEKEPGRFDLIPTNFTDIYEEDPFIAVSNGRCDMTFNSIVSLLEIIKAIKQS